MQIYGLGAVVEVHDEYLPTQFSSLWRRCLQPADESVARAEALTPPPEPSLSNLTQLITRRLIAARAGQVLMLHAGALCHPVTGATLAYVGPGGSGKTTLTSVFGQRYGYLTDETVAVTTTGRVLAYPKPLSVRETGSVQKTETSPDALGLLPAHPAPQLAGIVLLARDATSPATSEDLDLLTAIEAMAPETSSLAALDRGLHQLADLIEQTRTVQRWHYTDAADLIGLASTVIGEAP